MNSICLQVAKNSYIYIYISFLLLHRVKASSWCLFVQSQQLKHLNSMKYFQSNNEETRAASFWRYSGYFIISATHWRRDIQILHGQSVVNELLKTAEQVILFHESIFKWNFCLCKCLFCMVKTLTTNGESEKFKHRYI